MRLSLWAILIFFAFSSCDSNRVFEETVDFSNAYWLADSIKSFDVNIGQADDVYNILFSIRNGVEYPHRNVYVHYTISDSTDNVLDKELRNFQLFHPKSGYPFGNGTGNLREHKFELLVGYKFPYEGPFKISFEQYMRYDSLPQVYSIGVRVERPM